MRERRWEIGICGTFDVANYGDLLFPLLAELELKERLGAVTLHRFSYHAKTRPDWPFDVTSVTALPQLIDHLDGLLIGGGFIIRFDKDVAPGYFPPAPEIHHPTGYWLTPALLALQHNVPVVWNAPGTDGKDIPAWAYSLMQTALTLSRYVSVRDESSRSSLEPCTNAPVAVVPDTAFGLPRLLNLAGTPSAEFTRLCEASGLDRPFIVVQAKYGLEGFVRFIKNHAEQFRDFRFVALPIGPALGDREEIIDVDLPGVVRLGYWPSPLVLAELIGRSEAVVGQSYHLCITALASGVPVFARHDQPSCKYSVLHDPKAFFVLPPNGEPDLAWFLARIGRTTPSAAAHAKLERLRDHWDSVAAALRRERAPTAPMLNRFWQSIPTLLEGAATLELEAAAVLVKERAEIRCLREALATSQGETVESQKRLGEALAQLGVALQQAAERQESLDDKVRKVTVVRSESAARDARIAELLASLSWKVTAPLRFVGRQMLRHRRRHLINLGYIRHHRLETNPYRWAAINNLFNQVDVARLAATYPCDHFKLLATNDGEKDHQYEVRALIGMGADVVTYRDDLSDAWQALAVELLSPAYRAAMTELTGCDLSSAPMEVNVFHYGPGGSLGAHRDLPEKLVTHVLYFNQSWNAANGGCLRILSSSDLTDVAAEIPPLAGHSSVIVRSQNSWHAVTRVAQECGSSRRSVNVTFYRPGSVSTMWPPNDITPLHRFEAADLI
jgi:hypothetical protein